MSVIKKINLYLADSTKQVSEYIAQDYTDEELLAKFRRNPTDDVLWQEILYRELDDDPVVSALAGEKLLQVARGAGQTEPPENVDLTYDTGDGEDEDAEYTEGDGMMEALKRGKALKGNYSERKLPKGAKLINATQAYVIGNPEAESPEWKDAFSDTVTVFEKGKGKGWQPWWTMSKHDFQLEFGIKV